MNNEDLILNLIISLIITVVAYCTVPIILRLKNGKYEYEKGRKIVLTNCIIVCVFFVCMRLSQGAEQIVSPAVFLYYYINKAILVKPKEESKEDSKDEVKEENIEFIKRDKMDEVLYKLAQEDKKEMPKEIEEKNHDLICGEDVKLSKIKIEQNERKSINEIDTSRTKKNRRINHDKESIILCIVIIILIILLLGIIIYAALRVSEYKIKNNRIKKKYENEIEMLNYKIDELKEEYSDLEAEKNEQWVENIKNSSKLKFFDEKIVFVIDGYGNYYYTYDQMEVVTQGVGVYSYWAYNKEQAISLGYEAWPNY